MNQILKWCDKMVPVLRQHGIRFVNGLPVLPSELLYTGVPLMIETFSHRNDIPDSIKQNSLICYFSKDDDLYQRILKIEEEVMILKKYGGICGFDFSPCITMLRPRQKFSLLVSAIFNCYVAISGIKVLFNIRVGDLGTMSTWNSIPVGTDFISGEVGCHTNEFKTYGLYQLKLLHEQIQPKKLFIYGQLSNKDIRYICGNQNQTFFMYPGRRHRMRDGKTPTVLIYQNFQVYRQSLNDYINDGGTSYGSESNLQ